MEPHFESGAGCWAGWRSWAGGGLGGWAAGGWAAGWGAGRVGAAGGWGDLGHQERDLGLGWGLEHWSWAGWVGVRAEKLGLGGLGVAGPLAGLGSAGWAGQPCN